MLLHLSPLLLSSSCSFSKSSVSSTRCSFLEPRMLRNWRALKFLHFLFSNSDSPTFVPRKLRSTHVNLIQRSKYHLAYKTASKIEIIILNAFVKRNESFIMHLSFMPTTVCMYSHLHLCLCVHS